jgi:hypothetical protein
MERRYSDKEDEDEIRYPFWRFYLFFAAVKMWIGLLGYDFNHEDGCDTFSSEILVTT